MNKYILIFAAIVLFSCGDSSSEGNVLSRTVDSLKTENDSLKLELSTFSKDSVQSDTANNIRPSQNTKQEVNKRVEESLRKSPELIPLEPILGGTMHFGEIKVVSDDLVLADYEDGHIMGQTLYEYKVGGDGRVTFKAIRSKEY